MADTLKAEAGSLSSGGGQVRLRKGLVVAQISLSLMLLIGAGLFARSLFNLRNLHPGFTTENLLTFAIQPPLSGYRETKSSRLFREDHPVAFNPSPEYVLVSASDTPLMTQDRNIYTVRVEGYTGKGTGGHEFRYRHGCALVLLGHGHTNSGRPRIYFRRSPGRSACLRDQRDCRQKVFPRAESDRPAY